jgi:hypothetical protein
MEHQPENDPKKRRIQLPEQTPYRRRTWTVYQADPKSGNVKVSSQEDLYKLLHLCNSKKSHIFPNYDCHNYYNFGPNSVYTAGQYDCDEEEFDLEQPKSSMPKNPESTPFLQNDNSIEFSPETNFDDLISQFINKDYIPESYEPSVDLQNESVDTQNILNSLPVCNVDSPIGNSVNHADTNESNTTVCIQESDASFRIEQPNTTLYCEDSEPVFTLEHPNRVVCSEKCDSVVSAKDNCSLKRNCNFEFKNIVGKLSECLSVIQTIMKTHHFENYGASLHNEMGGVHNEMGGVHNEMGGVHNEMGGVHNEMGGVHNEMGGVHNEMGGVHNEMGGVHNEMKSVQQRNDSQSQDREFLKKQRIAIREANVQLQNTQNMLIRDMHHIRTERIRLEEDKRKFLKYKSANENMHRTVSQAYIHENLIVFKMKQRIYYGDISGKELLGQLEGNILITANNIDNIFYNLLPHISSVSVRCCINGKLYSLDYFDSIDYTQIYVTIQGFDYSTKVIESAHIVLDLKV